MLENFKISARAGEAFIQDVIAASEAYGMEPPALETFIWAFSGLPSKPKNGCFTSPFPSSVAANDSEELEVHLDLSPPAPPGRGGQSVFADLWSNRQRSGCGCVEHATPPPPPGRGLSNHGLSGSQNGSAPVDDEDPFHWTSVLEQE